MDGRKGIFAVYKDLEESKTVEADCVDINALNSGMF